MLRSLTLLVLLGLAACDDYPSAPERPNLTGSYTLISFVSGETTLPASGSITIESDETYTITHTIQGQAPTTFSASGRVLPAPNPLWVTFTAAVGKVFLNGAPTGSDWWVNAEIVGDSIVFDGVSGALTFERD